MAVTVPHYIQEDIRERTELRDGDKGEGERKLMEVDGIV